MQRSKFIISAILYSIIKMKTILIVCLGLLITQSVSKCSDSLSCFKNKLFNFGSPGENIYYINSITSNKADSSLNIMAYGDFNSDLHTDFIASNLLNSSQLYLYIWNSDDAVFSINQTINTAICPASSIFLYDMDMDGMLDILIWGSVNGMNCLLPFQQQQQNTFVQRTVTTMQKTANPFVISYGPNNAQKTVGLLVYQNGSRVIMKYESSFNGFINIIWSNVFATSSVIPQPLPFADPHWNSFLDLTGDCYSDVVIVNSNQQIEFWIGQPGNKFSLLNNSLINMGNFTSLSFADMNYDGLVDLVLAYQQEIKVFLNTYTLKDQIDFCVPGYKSLSFDLLNPVVMQYPQSYTMSAGNLQIKDINIDGYPDLLMVLSNTTNWAVKIFISVEGGSFEENKHYKLTNQTFQQVNSASFIDFWENGILDIVVCTKIGIFSYYNNYLQQNSYFIKGYGVSGVSTTNSTQIIGASFYWVNSVGEGYRTTYQPQIPQTAYNALQTPYSYCGLGRANNYVESFTLGFYGSSNAWSPIIPNSQLAVYAQSTTPKEWSIRVYVLPTDSLVYVVIVSALVLTVLGIVLVILKCKNYRKKEEPLMEFIH